MAVPVPEDYTTTGDGGRSGSTFSLNVVSSPVAGEVLYAIVTDDAGEDAIVWPSGWTKFWSHFETGDGSVAASGAWKLSDGTETGTISVTISASSAGALGVMYRISGCANPHLDPPRATYHDYDGGFYSHGAPVWGKKLRARDFLAFASYSGADYRITISNLPDTYTQHVYLTGPDIMMSVCHRNVPSSVMEMPTIYEYAVIDDDNIISTAIFPGKNTPSFPSTFPYVSSARFTGDEGRVTSTTYKMNLPDETQPGDIFIAIIAQPQVDAIPGAGFYTWPDGWTELFENRSTSSTTIFTTGMSAAWKKVYGGEGLTATLSEIPERATVCMVYCIRGAADPDDYPPEYEIATGLNDYASITPSYGSANYLWLIASAKRVGGTYYQLDGDFQGTGLIDGVLTIDGEPNLYGDSSYLSRAFHHSDNTALTDNVAMLAAWKNETLSSESPGRSQIGTLNDYIIRATIAIYPGPFELDDWWYLAWEGKVRGSFM